MPRLATKPVEKQKPVMRAKPDDDFPKDPRHFLLERRETIDLGWYDICRVLPRVYDEEMYKSWKNKDTDKPFVDFEEYVRTELEMEYRTAMWNLSIGRAILLHGITRDQVKKLKWSKMKELASVMSEDMNKTEVKELITQAEELDYDGVVDMVRTTRSKKTGGVVVKKTTIKIVLTNDQAGVWDEAIALAKEILTGMGYTEVSPDQAAEFLATHLLISSEGGKVKHATQIKDSLHPTVAEVTAAAKEKAKGKRQKKEYANKGKKRTAKAEGKKTGKKAKAKPKAKAAKKESDSADDLDI